MVTEPNPAQTLIAKSPSYAQTRGGSACETCGATVRPQDQQIHTRWHQALAQQLPEDVRPAIPEGGFNIW